MSSELVLVRKIIKILEKDLNLDFGDREFLTCGLNEIFEDEGLAMYAAISPNDGRLHAYPQEGHFYE